VRRWRPRRGEHGGGSGFRGNGQSMSVCSRSPTRCLPGFLFSETVRRAARCGDETSWLRARTSSHDVFQKLVVRETLQQPTDFGTLTSTGRALLKLLSWPRRGVQSQIANMRRSHRPPLEMELLLTCVGVKLRCEFQSFRKVRPRLARRTRTHVACQRRCDTPQACRDSP
jgi:hypothetical protein